MVSSFRVVLKLVVMLFAVVSTLVGGVQGNEVVPETGGGNVCVPYLPCHRPGPCCPTPSGKATNP